MALFLGPPGWPSARRELLDFMVQGKISSSSSSSFFPRLISAVGNWMFTILWLMLWPYYEFRMQVWNALHVAHCKLQDAKNRHLGTIAQLCRVISSQLRHASTIEKKNLSSSNISSTCPDNMVNFGPLPAEIGSGVWGTPTNFNRFCVLAALLHGI